MSKENGKGKKYQMGIGWLKTFPQGGECINFAVNKEKFDELPVDKHGNVFLTITTSNPEFSKADSTHWVYAFSKDIIEGIEKIIAKYKNKDNHKSEADNFYDKEDGSSKF
jgi:hypothetical protein